MAGSFEVLLSSLLSTESTIRVQAEEQYNGLALQLKLTHLISALRSGGSAADVKILAAVLLRRLFLQSADELVRVDVSILQACRSELLLAIQTEESPPVRRKICDAVAELARASIDDTDTNHWPDILKFLFECCSLDRPILYESALHIIRIVPAVFASQLEQYFEMIRQLLLQALNGPSHDVGEQAFRAACALLVSLEFPSLRQRLVDLLPSMLTVLWRSIEAQDDDAAFKAFIDLGEHRPKLLRSQLEKILDMMLKVMQIEDADNWKQLALEMVVTLAENAAPMIRKHDKFLPQIVETSLKFMLEIEDDEEWSTTDDVGEDEDSGSTAIAGETALDRLANALGGKAILPHIIRTIPQMLMSSDWQYRHAALMAISAIGEGCEKQMISVLEQVIVSVLPFCRDTHHRVKYAACNALGQMSSDFAPRLQEQHHSQIVPALLVALEESTNLRVKTHAGAALVNFCEPCPTEILVQYLPAIMPKLEGLLQLGLKELVENGRRLVIEQAITTLGTVADSVDEQFVPYYDHFMPSLKYVMANATSKELRLLRGKTIECVSIIGLAVGREKFMPDAQDILQMLFKFQNEQETLDSDDPQVSYMISAWARMCKIIGPESFLQYLPFVIKPLIQAASVKPEIAIVDSIEAEQNFSESEGWEFVTLADQQQFGIKTAGMDDKCTAMQMLVVYAKDLQDGFADYAEEVAKMMVPHLRFYFNELVRASAAQILPFLLECVKSKGPEVIQQMWMYISEKLLECIPLEPDTEITGIMIDSLCKCVELLGGTNCFTPEQYAKIVEIINDKLTGCLMREKERQDQRIDEDYDEQVEEELEEEDENDDFIMRKITDLVHSLFQTHGLTLIPLFDQIVPTLNKMLGVGQPSGQRAYAMCMYDDLLEFAGQSAVNYQQFFLNPLLDGIVDNSPVVRQAAGFGVGVMAQYCSKDFATTCLNSLSLLVSAIQRPDAREDFDSVNATENAIAAVAKICKHISNGVPYDSILPLWLSWLPVVEDRVEAVHVYSYLCDLIEGNNSLILGQNNSNVPKILSIIGEAVSRNVLERDNQVLQRLLAIVRHVQASGEVWQACIRLLSEKQQTALTTALAK